MVQGFSELCIWCFFYAFNNYYLLLALNLFVYGVYEMTFSDLSEFCRFCLLPLNDSYIDCALDTELKDTIKMVYNIDVSRNKQISFLLATKHFFSWIANFKIISNVVCFFSFRLFPLVRFKRRTNIRRCVSSAATFCCATRFIMCVPWRPRRVYHAFRNCVTNCVILARRKSTKRNRSNWPMPRFSMILKWKLSQIVRGKRIVHFLLCASFFLSLLK